MHPGYGFFIFRNKFHKKWIEGLRSKIPFLVFYVSSTIQDCKDKTKKNNGKEQVKRCKFSRNNFNYNKNKNHKKCPNENPSQFIRNHFCFFHVITKPLSSPKHFSSYCLSCYKLTVVILYNRNYLNTF